MLAYIGRRALLAVFTVWAISVLAFAIIQLPPGDYVTSYIAQMASMGSVVTDEEAENLRIQYGLGQPIYVQYWKWMKQIAEGNFGLSMEWRRPVTEVIGERLWLTVIVAVCRAAPHVGAGAADRHLLRRPPVLVGDYVATFVGLHRPGRPQLPAGAGPALSRLRPVQRPHRRAVLAGVPGRAVEPGRESGICSSTCRSRR